jgi:DNA polymerase III epsilon subunit-like protein
MVKFDYLPDGRIAGLRDVFTSFNEPSGLIPAEVTALTGITAEMVAGHKIDEAAVSSFVADAVIVIAHNAGFDRKFAERYWPIFERKAWGWPHLPAHPIQLHPPPMESIRQEAFSRACLPFADTYISAKNAV